MLDEDDHRALGQRLDLFHFQDEAPGMAFWHPRGFTIYRQLEEAVRRRLRLSGYREVRTPQLLRRPIWETSGHWQSFAADMFVVDGEAPAALKPVSCPGHLQIVHHAQLSYRDLPLRLAELGLVHRNEPSGVLHGLFRLRQFTQDDGHIFCSEAQVDAEIAQFAGALRAFYAGFGFVDIEVALSTRPAVRAGDDAVWDRAEALLADAARAAGLVFVVQPGEGAFYGPKLEFALRDRLGRAWQCGTIQLDFILPARFGAFYVDASGARRPPVMLHRAFLGSFERFLGLLLEQSRGALPDWLAPVQLVVALVGGAPLEYAERIARQAEALGLRVELDARHETLARKLVDAHAAGTPHVAIAGQREAAASALTIRDRDGAQRTLPLDEALAQLHAAAAPPL
jgi:threonyl-tRNA synthetase